MSCCAKLSSCISCNLDVWISWLLFSCKQITRKLPSTRCKSDISSAPHWHYQCNLVNCDLLSGCTAGGVEGMQPVKVTASFISSFREIQQGGWATSTPLQKRNICDLWPYCSPEMGWCYSTHSSASCSPSHPHTGLFMAQCMAHKKKSTLHNYWLINWTIFYVVGEAADRLQIICQGFRGCVSYWTTLRVIYWPPLLMYVCVCLSVYVCVSLLK